MLRSQPLMRAAALSLFLASTCCLSAAPTAAATAAPAAQPLAASSPFLPAGVSDSGPAANQGGAIELRGEMSTPEGLAFCIYDTVAKKGTWVREGESGFPFVVKSHDLNRDSVTVTYQGRTMSLALPAVKVASSGAGNAPVVNGPASAPSPDDAQKLAAIAAEVARRRQMREQELQKNGNGPGVIPPQQPVQPGPPQQIPSNGQPPQRRRQTQPPQ